VRFEPFDIVVVPFPFSERAAAKRRPALVVSARDFNARHAALVLAMITTAKGGAWASDVPIAEWREAGLTAPCRLRLKLFTLDSDLIVRRLGALSPRDADAARAALGRSLAVG